MCVCVYICVCASGCRLRVCIACQQLAQKKNNTTYIYVNLYKTKVRNTTMTSLQFMGNEFVSSIVQGAAIAGMCATKFGNQGHVIILNTLKEGSSENAVLYISILDKNGTFVYNFTMAAYTIPEVTSTIESSCAISQDLTTFFWAISASGPKFYGFYLKFPNDLNFNGFNNLENNTFLLDINPVNFAAVNQIAATYNNNEYPFYLALNTGPCRRGLLHKSLNGTMLLETNCTDDQTTSQYSRIPNYLNSGHSMRIYNSNSCVSSCVKCYNITNHNTGTLCESCDTDMYQGMLLTNKPANKTHTHKKRKRMEFAQKKNEYNKKRAEKTKSGACICFSCVFFHFGEQKPNLQKKKKINK